MSRPVVHTGDRFCSHQLDSDLLVIKGVIVTQDERGRYKLIDADELFDDYDLLDWSWPYRPQRDGTNSVLPARGWEWWLVYSDGCWSQHQTVNEWVGTGRCSQLMRVVHVDADGTSAPVPTDENGRVE